MERSSGILLHVTSLPGGHGIGDLGPAAYQWVEQLARAKQSWWQVLPLGPTGYADSPYQCFSAFAGNPNLISLERLAQIADCELQIADWPKGTVDFERVTALKLAETEEAWQRFKGTRGQGAGAKGEFERFCEEEREWLDDFAVFVALKEKHGGVAWREWPEVDRIFNRKLAAKRAVELAESVELCKFRQFLFFQQWKELREYAHSQGVRLIGDMPIFISSDSADAWSRPELFQLDDERKPKFVAGVPPDYFSATGQLWGNPLYDWARHRATGYEWWINRLRSTLKLVDLVRLDHFRGFEAYWSVPAANKTAEGGQWVPGPRDDFFRATKAALGTLPLIAEDLGVITPEVDGLRKEFGLPGMRILQFAFGGAQEDRFFPHNYDQHTVVYTGTHDNETTVGWYANLTTREQVFFDRYAPGAAVDPAWTLIRLAWASVADLAITPLQDVLRLGNEARMNLPGTAEGNWRWRVEPGEVTEELLERLGEMTTVYQRAGVISSRRDLENSIAPKSRAEKNRLP
jgi:4-alpha-glucanotransferase